MAAARKRGMIARLISLVFKLVFGFVALSLLMVVIYRFVPPPTTITMLSDANGATRDWTPLDRIDRNIMEVYLNVAETGIGTYGVEAGSQRYFGKGAASLTRDQAARMAAALPLPKKRSVKNPSGFVRRYGNNIARRIRIVQRDGLDSCARP